MNLIPSSAGPIALHAAATFATTEVRWFAEGDLPGSLVTWFTAARASIELRRDRYRIDGSPDVGLKRRAGGPLEVKIRCASSGTAQLDGSQLGRIEEWRKLIDVDEREVPVGPDPVWLDVDKVVLTRSYQWSTDGGMEPTASRDLSLPGCDVELASVQMQETAAWTFALEAWGPEPDRPSVLLDTLDAFTRETPLVDELVGRLESDCGYPEWLASVLADIRRTAGTASLRSG